MGGITNEREEFGLINFFLQTLGIPLDVAARLQLNLLVRPSESINLYKDVPEVYFPVMW